MQTILLLTLQNGSIAYITSLLVYCRLLVQTTIFLETAKINTHSMNAKIVVICIVLLNKTKAMTKLNETNQKFQSSFEMKTQEPLNLERRSFSFFFNDFNEYFVSIHQEKKIKKKVFVDLKRGEKQVGYSQNMQCMRTDIKYVRSKLLRRVHQI
eukprot:TRINITY_DN56961_c0_g1_i8.p3 TRINITY_DN56961_c0_g1~~TRINITY_DN56961_c0_g1_i8.p3  ORF type:complete len:154 (+),score=0.27 TRINITY_DN56961_c0_g1_i8:540-1001(+)